MKKSTVTIILGSVIAILGAVGVLTQDEASQASDTVTALISAALGIVELARGVKFRIEGKAADEAEAALGAE